MTNFPRFTKSANTMRHSVSTQIPSFYNEEGIGFVRFIQTYFKHLEGDVIKQTRNLQNIGDIDETPDDFLINFNNKFTFGASRSIRNLPSVITGDLRFAIKHIKDVYRSKGTVRGTKLFFRIAFNDAPEVFIPGEYLFTTSGSQYRRPDIIELSNDFISDSELNTLIGKIVVGSKTGATGTVANLFKKRVGQKTYTYAILDNIVGTFLTGDKVTPQGSGAVSLSVAPEVVGPVRRVEIITGGTRIPLGTTFNALPLEDGVELKLAASELDFQLGTFDPNPISGTLYSADSSVIITRAPLEDSGVTRGSYRPLVDNLTTNEDVSGTLLLSYANQFLANGTIYQTVFDDTDPSNPFTANVIQDIIQVENRLYGDLVRLEIAEEPSNYTLKPFVRVEDIIFTKTLEGTVTVSNTRVVGVDTVFNDFLIPVANTLTGNVDIFFNSNTINGNGTTFTSDFEQYDVIKVADESNLPHFFTITQIISDTELKVQSEAVVTSTGADYARSHLNYIKLIDELGNETIRVVNTSISNTELYLDDEVLQDELAFSSNISYQIGYPVGDTNFDEVTETALYNLGEDAQFATELTSDFGRVKGVTILNSGFGYDPRDQVVMRSENLTPVINITGGGGTGAQAIAEIDDIARQIGQIIITNPGSGYETAPVVTFEGGTGQGAQATAVIEGGSVVDIQITNPGSLYRRNADIIIKPIKSGQGILEGRTLKKSSETSEFLRLQDSSFWQEYSYEIGSAVNSDKYVEIVDDLLHMSGRRFFTKGLIKDDIKQSRSQISVETVTVSGV